MTAPSPRGVTLVLGPPNSGKRGIAVDWWQERLGSRPLFTMPTSPDAAGMSSELAQRTEGLVGQSQALTFTGLARLVLGRQYPIISEFERTVLVYRLLRSLRLDGLERVSHLPGVATAAGRLLQELGEGGRSDEEIEGILRKWGDSEPSAEGLARDVQSLLSAYHQQLLDSGLTDQAVLVQRASEGARSWTRPVAFCGFTSFTAGQRALISRISQQAEVLVTLDYDRERGVGLCARSEVEWWLRKATEVVDVGPHARTYASAAIAYLERRLLNRHDPAENPPPDEESEGVRFMLSSGRRAEAESVAEQIVGLIRAGVEPGGIAVVVRQVRAWGRLLGDVFESCGIPYQADERRRLGETGLGYAFMQAVRGVASDDAEALLAFLHSPYSEAEHEGIHDLEARYRRAVGRGTRVLVSLADGRMVEHLSLPNNLIVAESPQLDLSAATALAERMLLSATRGADIGSRALETDVRAYSALTDALAVLDKHPGSNEPAEVLRLLAQVTVPTVVHQEGGAVQIISAQRARARRFDAVFVIGLVEGEFPGPVDAPSLLSTVQRNRLQSLGVGFPAPESGAERALFIGAATRAWRLLYLSTRDTEDDGGEAIPSRFWNEAKTVLGAGDLTQVRRTLADQVYAARSAPTLRHYLRSCVAEGRKLDDVSTIVPAWRREAPAVNAPDVVAELGSQESFSPSALESYARCPFAWFVERVVGRQEFETELDGRVFGELIHSVLGACYQSLLDDGLLPLKTTDVPEAVARADALIEVAVQGPDCPGTVGERRVAGCRLRGMVRRLFQAEAEAGGSLVYKESEVSLGGSEGVDIGGLRIRGRVDRIDVDPDGNSLFVFDYKSGSVPTAAALGSAEGLQVPIYLLALGAEREDAQIAGGAYLSLRHGTVSGLIASGQEGLLGDRARKCRVVTDADRQELLEEALSVAQTAAENMRAGDIAPRPDRVCPRWCDLGPVCRARRGERRS